MMQIGGTTLCWGKGDVGDKSQVYSLLRDLFPSKEIPTNAQIAYNPKGKPYLPDHPHCHISVSHSGDFLLCGLSHSPIGVDIELLRPRRPSLPARVLAPEELRWFCSRGERWEDFYSLWVLKESLLKCQGTGIDRPLREVLVPTLEVDGHALWQGHHFYLFGTDQWRGALCI